MEELLGGSTVTLWLVEPNGGHLRCAATGDGGFPPDGDIPGHPVWPLMIDDRLLGMVEFVEIGDAMWTNRSGLEDLVRHLASAIESERDPRRTERKNLLSLLEHTAYASGRWNIARAARELDVPRKSLEYRIRQIHGLIDPTLL
jgi:hypothetical protein